MSARVAPSNTDRYNIFDLDTDDEKMEDQIALNTKEIIRMVSQVDESMDNENGRQALSLTMSQTIGEAKKVTDVVKKRRASVITRSASVAAEGDRLTIVKDGHDVSKSKKVLEGMKGMNRRNLGISFSLHIILYYGGIVLFYFYFLKSYSINLGILR